MFSSNFGSVTCHWFATSISISAMLLTGCQDSSKPQVVPVAGKVLYNGKPLEFGSVAFQPPRGQRAKGAIQSDGTFILSTYRPEDGVPLGHHKVRIVCYESQKPGYVQPGDTLGEPTLGKLLIPRKYTLFDRSGLTANVEEASGPFMFELKGP